MIRSFRDQGTEDVFKGLDTKAARRNMWTESGPQSVEITDYH